MSQICTSSSHQLVAAAVAFRRARRKFPKDFGAQTNAQSSSVASQGHSSVTKDERNHETDSTVWSTKSPDELSGDFQDDKSAKENLSDRPMTCRYCQRRTEFEEDEVPVKDSQDETNNTVDMIPSRESNVLDPQKPKDQRRYDTANPSKSPVEKKDHPHHPETFDSHYCSDNRRIPSNLLPKMKSADILYDSYHSTDNAVHSHCLVNRRNCPVEMTKNMCGCKERVHQLAWGNSKGWAQQMHQTRSDPCACEYPSARSIDLLRPFQDHSRRCRQEYRRDRGCYHHHCSHQFNAENWFNPRTKHASCFKRNYLCTLNACPKDNRQFPLGRNVREYDGTSGILGHQDSFLDDEKSYYPEEMLSSRSEYRGKFPNDVCSCGEGSMRLIERTCCAECDQIYGQGDFHKLKYSNRQLKKQGTYNSPKNGFLRSTI